MSSLCHLTVFDCTFGTWYAELASFKGQLQSILLMQCFSVNYIRCIAAHKKTPSNKLFWVVMSGRDATAAAYATWVSKATFPFQIYTYFLQGKWHIACHALETFPRNILHSSTTTSDKRLHANFFLCCRVCLTAGCSLDFYIKVHFQSEVPITTSL